MQIPKTIFKDGEKDVLISNAARGSRAILMLVAKTYLIMIGRLARDIYW